MSKISGRKSLTAVLSIVAIGTALSFGMAKAVAADDVTEDQIVRALAPVKKPLTRGLSVGPQADPAANAAEDRFVQTLRGRGTRSLSASEREEISASPRKSRISIWKSPSITIRPISAQNHCPRSRRSAKRLPIRI